MRSRTDSRSFSPTIANRLIGVLDRREGKFIVASIVLFGFVFLALLTIPTSGIDLSHYFYLPVAPFAVATGPLWGALARMGANGLYAVALALTHGSGYQLDSTTTLLRFSTVVGIGLAAGGLARRNLELLERLNQEANYDHPTGLLNLRGFDAAFARRRDLGTPFALTSSATPTA